MRGVSDGTWVCGARYSLTKRLFHSPHHASVTGVEEDDMRQRSTRAALLAVLAGAIAGCAMEGIDQGGADQPPDTQVAISETHMMEATNEGYKILRRSDNTVFSRTFFDIFPGGVNSPCGTAIVTDPRLRFHRQTGRWFLVHALEEGSVNTQNFGGWCLAVSKTGNPLGAWRTFFIPLPSHGPNCASGYQTFCPADSCGCTPNSTVCMTMFPDF